MWVLENMLLVMPGVFLIDWLYEWVSLWLSMQERGYREGGFRMRFPFQLYVVLYLGSLESDLSCIHVSLEKPSGVAPEMTVIQSHSESSPWLCAQSQSLDFCSVCVFSTLFISLVPLKSLSDKKKTTCPSSPNSSNSFFFGFCSKGN